jgi:hypothetical protein
MHSIIKLKDRNGPRYVNVAVHEINNALYLHINKYGEHEDPEGFPVALELWDGKLQLIVRDDINDPNPKIINLEGSKETNRIEPKD